MSEIPTPSFQDMNDPLMTDVQVEALLGVSKGWAAKDRIGKARISFVKIGRSVRYRRADVFAFIERNVRKSTSDVRHAETETRA